MTKDKKPELEFDETEAKYQAHHLALIGDIEPHGVAMARWQYEKDRAMMTDFIEAAKKCLENAHPNSDWGPDILRAAINKFEKG